MLVKARIRFINLISQVYLMTVKHLLNSLFNDVSHCSLGNAVTSNGINLISVQFFSPGATTPIQGCILQPSSGL